MGSLDGRVAVITGAGRGIGREEALLLADEGAKVVVNDPGVETDGSGGDTGVAAAVVEEITARGGTAVANTDSVSDWRGAEQLVATAVDTFGDLHVVVNNAAVARPRALVNMSEEEFDAVVDVKLKGAFAVSHWAARHWRERHEAGDRTDRTIVNTSSASGLDSPFPLNTNYAAANAGIGAMTIVHALELARYGVRVNCISPGARSRLSGNLPGGLTSLTQGTPQAGGYDPWHPVHQAAVVAQLATADCPLNGQVLMVRGSTVTLGRNWSFDERITKEGAGWGVEELGDALEKLPVEDPFDQLVPIGAAYGITGRDQVRQLLDTILDGDDRAE